MAGKFWTASWSPILGCDPDMPCARRCWALRLVNLMARNGTRPVGIAMDYADDGDHWSGQHVLIEHWLDKPLHWRKPRVVATGWLGDMWLEINPQGADELFDMRDKAMSVAFRDECQHHQFLHLTKHPNWMFAHLRNYVRPMRDGFPGNQWWGATVTNQADADERIPHLLRIPGKRWMCVEPLIGPVDIASVFGWSGDGEPGPGRRRSRLDQGPTPRGRAREASAPGDRGHPADGQMDRGRVRPGGRGGGGMSKRGCGRG